MVLNLLRSRSTSVCQAKHLNLHAHAPKPTHEPLTEDYRVMIYTATIILTDRQETKVPASVAPTWAALMNTTRCAGWRGDSASITAFM